MDRTNREAQSFFEADDAVLNFERVETDFENGGDEGQHDDDHPCGMNAGVAEDMDDDSDQCDDEDGQDEKVEWWIPAGVMGITLRRSFSHGGVSLIMDGNSISTFGGRMDGVPASAAKCSDETKSRDVQFIAIKLTYF